MKIRMKICLTIFVTAWALVHGGCATFKPPSIAAVPFQERAQTQQKNGVRVNAAVLSEKESRAAFGVPLYSKGVQPVWIEIANSRNEPVWFLPYGIDPDYFAPLEVAYKFEFGYSKKGMQELNRHFFKNGVRVYVSSETIRSGFVFTNLDQGTKSFNVDVINDDKSLETFTFFIAVPGLKVDHHKVDFERLYPADQVVTLDEKGLRKALQELPCCTYDKKGAEKGDPLNLVFIGNPKEVYYALIRAGWDETETVYGASLWKTAMSFLFGGRYRYSPVSALYVFGRPQDSAFQKARGSIHERNHLRIWLAPIRYAGKMVWAGQISRDIGVRFTTKTITTHKIDPDVDEARIFLIQNLWYTGGLEKFAFIGGVGEAPLSRPRQNLTGDPYVTDGLRAVLWVSGHPVPFDAVEFKEWDIPPVN